MKSYSCLTQGVTFETGEVTSHQFDGIGERGSHYLNDLARKERLDGEAREDVDKYN